MARPKKNDTEKRVNQLNIRLTKEETAKITGWAKASGQDTAAWCRQRLLTGKFPPPKIALIDADTYKELRKIGVNINQAVHKLNLLGENSDYLTESYHLLAWVKKIGNALLNPTHDRQPDKR
jgi:hypothetical protein